jgi:NADH:ubiquinone oxidoreductase subunit 2 (subunit N)
VIGILAGLLVLISGVAFMRPRTTFKGEFFAFLLFAVVAMNLMAGGNDLVTIAVAIEFLSITSYLLTGWLRGDRLSGEGALKYFLYGSIASAVMLYGFSLMYGATGSTSIPQIAAAVADPTTFYESQISNLMLPALMLALVGVGFKIAVVPVHQWSPDA